MILFVLTLVDAVDKTRRTILLGSYCPAMNLCWLEFDAEDLHSAHTGSVMQVDKGVAPLFDPRDYWASADESQRTTRDPVSDSMLLLQSELESYLDTCFAIQSDSDDEAVQVKKSTLPDAVVGQGDDERKSQLS